MPAINRQRLGTGLLFILFGVIYFDRTHGSGYTPADKSLVLFLVVFGSYACIRAFDSFFRKDTPKSDSA